MPQGLQPTTRVGIIHLFSTGPGTEHNALVQISAVRFSAKRAPLTQSWVLNPGRRITQRLFKKTGLSNRDCTSPSAQLWSQAKLEVQSFLRGLDVLFFVDTESRQQWLTDIVLKGMADAPALVDLATMAHFFLPGKQRAYTDAIVNDLDTNTRLPKSEKSMRALGGARVLLKAILTALYQGQGDSTPFVPAVIYLFHYLIFNGPAPPGDAAKTFAPLLRVALGASQINWEHEQLLADGFGHLKPFPDSPELPLKATLAATLKPIPKAARPFIGGDECDDLKDIDPEYVQEMLKRTIASGSADWVPRENQKTYLKHCSRALRDGGVYALEAGTGTGKTLGYLLPACQFATLNQNCQVFIASSTKNLAEQLHDHEWPKIPRQIRSSLTTAVLLGKRNYVCRFSVISYLESDDFAALSTEDRLAWLYMFMVLRHGNGIIEDIPRAIVRLLPGVKKMLAEFNAEAACSRDSCQNYNACTYATSLNQAREANIVFTNHHKLVLQFSAADIKRAAVLIIDEADQFAENARMALRASSSKTEIDLMMRRLKGGRTRRGFLDILDESFRDPNADIDPNLRDSIRSIRRDCERIETNAFNIGEFCVNLAGQDEIRWSTLKPADQSTLQLQLEELGSHLISVGRRLEDIRDSERYENVDDKTQTTSKKVEMEYRRLSRYSEQTAEWGSQVQQFAANHGENREGFVHTLMAEKRLKGKAARGIPSWLITQYAFEIGEQICKILDERHATIFTSATLYVNESLDLFKRDLLGQSADEVFLEGPPAIPSEFDYPERVMGGMLDLFGQPFNFKWSDSKKRQWHQAMACAIGMLTVVMYGRTLVLFTSIRDMKMYYQWLYPALAQYDVELLIQDGPSYAETELFRTTEHSVLFGVNRFWSGVDFPGSTCSQIIVVRTPNLPFYDPLVKHRKEVMPSYEFWGSYYHPKVRLRFIQQFGRLMRRKTDRGLFVTLDSRALKHADIFPIEIRPYQDWRPIVEQGLRHMGYTPEIEARGITLDQAWDDIRTCVYSSEAGRTSRTYTPSANY